MIQGGYRGRLLGARLQHKKKVARVTLFKDLGMEMMKDVNERDIFMLGLGLYLGEGNKKGNHFQFANSNPKIVNAALIWLEKAFEISRKDIYCNVFINNIHADRIEDVQKRWARVLKISLRQFNKPVFIKARSKKVYENRNEHLGTLIFRVKRSSDLQYRVLGLIHGLMYKLNQYGQRSSMAEQAFHKGEVTGSNPVAGTRI